MVNFYRKFVPAAAKILYPLTTFLCGGKATNVPVQWTPDMLAAFSTASWHTPPPAQSWPWTPMLLPHMLEQFCSIAAAADIVTHACVRANFAITS
jgi:hypothetical protein